MAAFKLERTTVRRIIKKDLKKKPLKTVSGRRVGKQSAAARLKICEARDADMRDGKLGPKRIFFADEKIFRLGHTGRLSGQNHRVYVDDATKKGGVPSDLLVREKPQGGNSVMVGLGVGYNGVGTLHTVEKNLKINGDVYGDIVKNVYQVDCYELFGDDYVFQQGNAPAHTKNEVKARTGARIPAMMDPWPACSPDLNALDFAVRGILDRRVDDAVRE